MTVTTFPDTDQLVAHLRWLGTQRSVEGAFSELDHGLQTAAELQRTDPDDLELQVAGLVHDLAHPWDGAGQPRHAALGADAVRPVLGDRVARLVEGHVAAKRYLVTVDPGYGDWLSPDSVTTLRAQGGAMTDDEVAAFAADPDVGAMVALRPRGRPGEGRGSRGPGPRRVGRRGPRGRRRGVTGALLVVVRVDDRLSGRRAPRRRRR